MKPFASSRGAAALGLGALLTLLAGACASTTSSSHAGSKVLDAVVIEREYEPPGSQGGGSYRGSGNYYLSFEAQDGDRTARYRFPVTHQQYARYTEGTRVQLVLLDDILREIRPGKE
jgi:hypothetical protein